ncbi:MAG: hypothetical protein KGL79_05995 [Acidobacteriota bacterium]|nr:hypothetical protein [Acidobacteriota bacterium]
MRSIDPPRRRPAPLVLRGRDAHGGEREVNLEELTLLIVVKPNCQACEELLAHDARGFEGFNVWYLVDEELALASDAPRLLRVSAATLATLEVRWPPAYLVVDPECAEVIFEGVVFDSGQIMEEIGHLARR